MHVNAALAGGSFQPLYWFEYHILIRYHITLKQMCIHVWDVALAKNDISCGFPSIWLRKMLIIYDI